LSYRFVLWWIGAGMTLFGLFAGIIATLVAHKPIIAAILVLMIVMEVVLLVFSWFCVRIEYDLRTYVVTDRSLRVREGVIGVREMTVNFANIQNISVSQGPLQRFLGISDLRVDTAGGGGATARHGQNISQNLHTAWFRGIENANQVRELIQDRLRHLKDSGLGDHEELHQPTAPSSDFLAALRGLHSEAASLRVAISKLSP
jgi:uncharacterized membrane protein YdbT with pleckstrin-like domain